MDGLNEIVGTDQAPTPDAGSFEDFLRGLLGGAREDKLDRLPPEEREQQEVQYYIQDARLELSENLVDTLIGWQDKFADLPNWVVVAVGAQVLQDIFRGGFNALVNGAIDAEWTGDGLPPGAIPGRAVQNYGYKNDRDVESQYPGQYI